MFFSKCETEVFMGTMHKHSNKFTLYHVNVELESYNVSKFHTNVSKEPDGKFEINQKNI